MIIHLSHVLAVTEKDGVDFNQTLRTGRPLVDGLSFHGVSGLCMSSLAHWLPGGIQSQGISRRPMQAWVSCSGGRTTACFPHASVALSVVSSVDPTLSTLKENNYTGSRLKLKTDKCHTGDLLSDTSLTSRAQLEDM